MRARDDDFGASDAPSEVILEDMRLFPTERDLWARGD